jgi:hypothetical protein
MDVRWNEDGGMRLEQSKGKPGEFVRLKAERDVVVVMSACPQDVEGVRVNGAEPVDAKFVVEDEEAPAQAMKRTQVRKKPMPASRKASSVAISGGAPAPVKKKPPPPAAVSKPATAAETPAKKTSQPAVKKPLQRPIQPTSMPKKKPIPPSRTASEKTNGDSGAQAPPVERKKPRKLVRPAKDTEG